MSDHAPARYLGDMPPERYHSDPVGEVPTLSSSCAATLINRSPFHAWLEHPRLGKCRDEETEAMSAGTLLHALVLGKGLDRIAVLDVDDYRTKDAKAARDAAIAAGRTPIKRAQFEAAERLATDVRAELTDRGIVLDGASEVAVTWTETATDGTPVQCRAQLDHVKPEAGIIYDLKTCRSAHPRAIQSHIIEYGYDVQHAAYTSALRKLHPELAGKMRMEFLFVETLPEGAPRRVLLARVALDGMFRELGARRWQRAIDEWAACLRTKRWPDYYGGNVVEIQAPGWILSNEGM